MQTELIERLLGIGVGASVAVLVAIYIVRGAVAKAVEQAGKREIESLKAQLAGELEKERQAFAREMEQERAGAARELEQFKSELSLQAEVRRQVAARKVSAVIEIVSAGEPLIRSVLNARRDRPEEKAKAIADVNAYVVKVRELAFLFDNTVAVELQNYASKIHRAGAEWEKNDPQAPTRANEAYSEMLECVRRELGVVAVATRATIDDPQKASAD